MIEEAPAASSRHRDLGWLAKAVVALCSFLTLGVAIFYMFRLTFQGRIFTESGYFYLLMSLLLPWSFVFLPISKKIGRKGVPWYDVLAVLASFGIPFYFFLTSQQALLKGWETIAPNYVRGMCLVVIVLVLEAVRRAEGMVLASLCLFFGLFPLFASHMPVPFKGVDYTLWRTVSFHVLGIESFLGVPMRVVATLLLGFLVFAIALMATGGGRFFINFALAILGHVRGGPAKVAVLSSALFGSISGSVVSNVLTTGSITIPTMKRCGYPPHYAGAVEACASTGGVLMPPIMGAAAFIIAQFLGIPYVKVAIAAAVPSVLYYLGLFLQVDAYAVRTGLKGLPRETLPSMRQTLKDGWFFIVSFVVLVWFLMYLRMEGQAPFYATALLIACSMVRKETRLTPRRFVEFLVSLGRLLSEILVVMLAVGLIIGSLVMTGVAHAFSSEVIELAGGNIPLLLILGAAVSFILGMGMSVTACYIFLAVLLAPALVSLGLYDLGVHLFVLYWGMISFITPPVCVGAITAAGLAEADPMKTGIQAVKLGAVIYLIPFFFVMKPALLLHGDLVDIVVSIGTAIIGVVFLAGGIEGYVVWFGRTNRVTRPIFMLVGVLLLYPNWLVSAIGALVVVVLVLVVALRKSKLAKPGGF